MTSRVLITDYAWPDLGVETAVLAEADYPFDMGITDPLGRLAAAGLPSSAREAIRGGNAAALLGALPAWPRDDERTGA